MGLAMDSENFARIYVIEKKELTDSAAARATKKRGPQNEGKSHHVIENKWRKNARLWVCHDVVEKKLVNDLVPRC
jgi:hypothetical protein